MNTLYIFINVIAADFDRGIWILCKVKDVDGNRGKVVDCFYCLALCFDLLTLVVLLFVLLLFYDLFDYFNT